MLAQESRPARPVAAVTCGPPHVALHCPLAHADAELEQLPADPLGAPPRIAGRDLSHERSSRRGRSTERSRTSSPQQAVPCSMPAQDRGRLKKQNRGALTGRETGGDGHCRTLPGRPTRPSADLPLRRNQLLSKKCIFGEQLRACAHEVSDQPECEPQQVDHAASIALPERRRNL